MAKKCLKCEALVNSKSYDCPYCGASKFEEVHEPQEQTIKVTIEQTASKEVESDGLYSPKILQLIEFALSDGELTEKEKQVLFKKAELEGIDLDEFEMVLDAKLKEHQTTHSKKLNVPDILADKANADAYNQLEMLMDFALKDGEVNEMERETIYDKGQKLGIARNEVMMILNSKLEEKQKVLAQNSAPKSDKFGDIRKCPACGSMVSSFSAKCGDCDYEFTNVEANASIQKLFQMLNEVENNRIDNSQPTSLLGTFNKISSLNQLDKTDKQKMEIIKNFPIPTTKDDIIEFLSLAVPNAKKIGSMWTANLPENKSHNDFVPVWKSKCEQIIMKAKFSLKNDKSVMEEIMNYAKEIGIK